MSPILREDEVNWIRFMGHTDFGAHMFSGWPKFSRTAPRLRA